MQAGSKATAADAVENQILSSLGYINTEGILPSVLNKHLHFKAEINILILNF